MVENKKINFMYVSNVLPEEILDKLGGSIAGNKFSLSICKELDKTKNKYLTIVSLSNPDCYNFKHIGKRMLWAGKEFIIIKKGNKPILSEIEQGIHFLRYAWKWSQNKIFGDFVIIINNSPAQITIPLIILKILRKVSCFSYIIDTPFHSSSDFSKLIGKVYKIYFKIGFWTLKFFNGIIAHSRGVLDDLSLSIPCFITPVGVSKYEIERSAAVVNKVHTTLKRKLLYAGTFIHYNGIREILEATCKLDSKKYELHLFGYGPLQRVVEQYSQKYSNIFFHGRLSNEDLVSQLYKYDLLLNIRIRDRSMDNFTFPSKILEYILSRRPILSTRFKTMPVAYNSFLHFIEATNVDSIASAIENVFLFSDEELIDMCSAAYNFVVKNQNYTTIIREIESFLENTIYG